MLHPCSINTDQADLFLYKASLVLWSFSNLPLTQTKVEYLTTIFSKFFLTKQIHWPWIKQSGSIRPGSCKLFFLYGLNKMWLLYQNCFMLQYFKNASKEFWPVPFTKCIVILRFLRQNARMKHENQLNSFKTLNIFSLTCVRLITMNFLDKLFLFVLYLFI